MATLRLAKAGKKPTLSLGGPVNAPKLVLAPPPNRGTITVAQRPAGVQPGPDYTPHPSFIRNIISSTINPFSRFANEIGALYQIVQPTRASIATRQNEAAHILNGGGGLGHQGGVLQGRELGPGPVFIGPDAIRNIEATAGTGAQIASTLYGPKAGWLMKGNVPMRVIKGATSNAALAGVGDAGYQVAETGKIDPKELALSAAGGGLLGAGGAAAKVVKSGLSRSARRGDVSVPIGRGTVGESVAVKGVRPPESPKISAPAEPKLLTAPKPDVNTQRIQQIDRVLEGVRQGQIKVNAKQLRGLVSEKQRLEKAVESGSTVNFTRAGRGKTPTTAVPTAESVTNVGKGTTPVVEKPVAQTMAKAEKPNVAQSSPTPVSEASGIPADLTNPGSGKMARSQSALDKKIRRGGYLNSDARKHLDVLYHEIHSQNKMKLAAERLVQNDRKYADNLFMSGELAKTNPDANIKLGQALSLQAAREGDVAAVNRLEHAYQGHITTHGQSLRASQVGSLLTPHGIVRYAHKIADMQGKTLKKEEVAQLEEMARAISKKPDGPEKDALISAMKDLAENRNLWNKTVDYGFGVVSLPRAIMASTDLSFGLRQGLVLGSRFPKLWAEAQAKSAKFAVNPKYFEQEMGKLRNLTDQHGVSYAQVFKRMGLDLEAVYGRSEEVFGNTKLAESKAAKKVGVGHVIAGTDRGFSGAAAILRAKAAKQIIDGYGGIDAVTSKWTTREFKDLGRVINTGTGRGHGGYGRTGQWFEKAAPTLGQTLFSARLWKARLDLLSPLYYGSIARSPAARKLAIQSGSSFAALVGVTLAAAAAAGAAIETDMRSSDFGKIKIGNTRYDIMGGLQQNLVLAWRELSGESKSSSTGNLTDLSHPHFGGQNRLTVIGRTVENKLSPVLATILRQIQGADISGTPYADAGARAKDISSLGIPLGIQDTYSTATGGEGWKGIKEGNVTPGSAAKGVAQSLPFTTLGVGVSTYGKKPGSTNTQIKFAETGDKTSTADIIKAAMSGAVVDFQGQKMKWNDLNQDQQTQLAAIDPTARGFYDQQEAMKTGLAGPKMHPVGLDPKYSKVLDYFDRLTTKGKRTVFDREPAADYYYKLAKFEEDKASGKYLDDASLAKAKKAVDKAKVGASFTRDLRDTYTMTKGDLEKFLAKGDHKKFYNDLLKYDNALYDAGLISYRKFHNKYGEVTLAIGGSGSGSSGSSSSSSRGRSGGRRSIAVSKYQGGIPVKRGASTSLSTGSGPVIAIRRRSRGKITTRTIKNTT